MPIEIRASDVAFQKARAYQARAEAYSQRGTEWMPLLAQILSIARDRERVSEVNSGLATQMEFWPREREDFSRVPFDIIPQTPEGMQGLPPAEMAPIRKNLGEVNYEDVLDRHNKAVQAVANDINRTVRNRQAREELLQHLAQGSAQQAALLLQDWKAASQDHALAGLGELTRATLAQVKTLGSEEAIRRIEARITEMTNARQIKETEAAKLLEEVKAQAQYIEGYSGTLDAMNKDGLEAGTEWLKKNTPYWDSDPDTRTKVLQAVRAEWEIQGKLKDDELDRKYEGLNLKIVDKAGVLGALSQLKTEKFFDGQKQRLWQDYFEHKLEVEENKLQAPATAVAEVQKQNLGIAKFQLGLMSLDNKSKEDRIKWFLAFNQMYPCEPGAAAGILAGLQGEESLGLKYALSYLKDKKLNDPALQMKISLQLEELLNTPEGRGMKEAEIAQIVENKLRPDIFKKFDAIVGPGQEVPEEMPLKRMVDYTRDIEANLLAGLVPQLQTDLDAYNKGIFQYARSQYPSLGLRMAETDASGKLTGHRGSAILYDKDFNPYFFKVVGNDLELWGHVRPTTMGIGGIQSGKREWMKIPNEMAMKKRVTTEVRRAGRIVPEEVLEEGRARGEVLLEEAKQKYKWGNR